MPAAATIVAAAALSPAASASSPTIVVRGDSVLATSLSSFGQTTIEAIRPDALTGANVVIGLFTGMGNPLGPFSVNSTTPTPLNPAGDCWQKGALSHALTPDLLPGDTVTLSQAGAFGAFGSSPIPASVEVQSPASDVILGPISGCSGIAPWARNAINGGPSAVTDGPITVSGVAQPLASAVSISASDGTHTTAPVSATPASDGSWTATIPAAQVKRLANTTLTVTPVVAVPDVSTGAQAHIAGVGLTVKKSSPDSGGSSAQGATGTNQPAATPPNAAHHGSAQARVRGLRTASSLTLARARRNGIQASFVPPAGANIVRVALLQGKSELLVATLGAHKNGSRQTVLLRGKGLSRLHRAGVYTIVVQAGTGKSALGPMTTRTVRIL